MPSRFRITPWRGLALAMAIAAVCPRATRSAQEALADDLRLKAYDEILDVYVRDGYVYYRALRAERERFDGFVASLANVPVDRLPRGGQLAFWLNAYKAFVLRTIIDNYPIPKRTSDYPPHSIRQIPGAFERLPHRAGGRTLTIDEIEQIVLPAFRDPRVYLALGRGSVGGGRLRSEAFTPTRIEAQLTEVASECASRPQCFQVEREANRVSVSPIFSWREKDFVAAYSGAAPAIFADRSPIERAAIAFVEPKLLATEREFLDKNQFQLAYTPFDWSLNDLTGRGGR